MNEVTNVRNALQWESGRLEHGFMRRAKGGWHMESRDEAIWYSISALPDALATQIVLGYRTSLRRGLDFPDGLPCFACWDEQDREKRYGPINCIAEFPTHYVSDLESHQLSDPDFPLPALDPSKPIIGFPPPIGYADHGVYTRQPCNPDWIGITFGYIDDPVPAEFVQDVTDFKVRSFLRQRHADFNRAVSKFLSNPFEYNRLVRPMEVIFKDGRIASLAPAPRKCDFDGLRPAPTSSQSFELEIGLVEHMC